VAIKPGTKGDMTDSLAAAIQAAFETEYAKVKGQPLAPAGKEDQEMLFAAVAQGVVTYLKAHQADLKLVWSGTVPQDASPAHVELA
jgi:hypothetical protein